ncbi:hypothetical protein HYW54_04660 [Candidatus Gottesmanbacteria bacterium]|nr:hypothetical protein [Candidatus Gottesmanbacteria bacterium]
MVNYESGPISSIPPVLVDHVPIGMCFGKLDAHVVGNDSLYNSLVAPEGKTGPYQITSAFGYDAFISVDNHPTNGQAEGTVRSGNRRAKPERFKLSPGETFISTDGNVQVFHRTT